MSWYKNFIAWWNHERTLRRLARGSPFTLSQVREAYRWVYSYERLELIMDLAQEEDILLCNAYSRVAL